MKTLKRTTYSCVPCEADLIALAEAAAKAEAFHAPTSPGGPLCATCNAVQRRMKLHEPGH